jgi:hypothetical protein
MGSFKGRGLLRSMDRAGEGSLTGVEIGVSLISGLMTGEAVAETERETGAGNG